MIARLLKQSLIGLGALGVLLFVPAGTLYWPAAWLLLVTMTILGFSSGLWLAKTDPELLAERMSQMMQADQLKADKIFVMAFAATALIWFVVMGLDRRFQASHVPPALQAIGLLMLVSSIGAMMWVMRKNSFAVPVVKVQTERGQHVIDTGPYAYVRHPMYSAVVVLFVSVPIELGSWWGVAMAPPFVVLFAIRAVIEERALEAGLPGYANYIARVRYRLLPGLW
jgi:protein-S-isoprenylcysteine O-methyltransferase Ste14